MKKGDQEVVFERRQSELKRLYYDSGVKVPAKVVDHLAAVGGQAECRAVERQRRKKGG